MMHELNAGFEKTFTFEDKSTWGDGPWQDEPDKIVWIDPATDLDCMIHRAPTMGSLCGYVAVPPGHRLYGVSYDDPDVSVHGGLTYGSLCDPKATEEHGLCHVPAPGRPEDVWWFGFDCAHGQDLVPAMNARERALGLPSFNEMYPDSRWRSAYRDVSYVRAEVISLAAQLRALA